MLWMLSFFIFISGNPPVKKLTLEDLKGKTLQDLYLMRNEIYARHGRPFKTYELFAYFMGKEWYKPRKDYSDRELSPVEIHNAKLILEKERELLKHNYIMKDGRKVINFDNVINRFQFPEFTEEEIEKLSRNGFLVVPSKYKQLFHIYENNDYLGIASFITTDAVLQLYHLFFDRTLRDIEEKHLFNLLRRLTDYLIDETWTIYSSSQDSMIKKAAMRNLAYFYVPAYYLYGRDRGAVSSEVWDVVKREIENCEAHRGFAHPPILSPTRYTVDYSQFIPRGHYTRNDTLKNYFMAMMWYGIYALHPDVDIELIQALLITHVLYNFLVEEKPLISLWRKIYEITAFYVGFSDDIGPEEFRVVMERVFGKEPDISEFSDREKLKQVRKLLLKIFNEKTKIRQIVGGVPQGMEFRFMGQRYIPDSEIMQRLVCPRKRYFPKGLDVMAVLGSRIAKELMLERYKDDWKEWKEYPERLNELIEEFKKLTEEDWKKNLYLSWLWCLKSLLELNKKHKYPFFMQNDAWLTKSLNTSLASWAELRHDAILYAKPSGCAECGGGVERKWEWVPEPPKGYVEPNVEFYKRLKELLEFTEKGLEERGFLDPEQKEIFERFIELVVFLERVSLKELKGTPLSIEEYDQIRRFGSLLENLTLQIFRTQYWSLVEGPDREIPVIADVHTGGGAGQPLMALEEAVGYAFEIYVVVEIDGRLKLTRGAVFSYYEFLWPISDRLTDEKWQEMLREGKEPPLPDWIDVYFSPQPKKFSKPAYIPPAGIREKMGKGSGWELIYYETGC